MEKTDPIALFVPIGSYLLARICREAEKYDLVVIGASEVSLFQRVLFGLKPRKIAEGCSCTVLIALRNSGIKSWFKRWFI